MKESLVKQDIKMEWESHRPENNSPQVPQSAEEQAGGSPRTVITTRRHVRTITTTGHITESIAEPESESPEPSPVSANLQQQVIQQQQHQQHSMQEHQQQQEHHQQFGQLSHGGSPGEAKDQRQHLAYTANGQELVEEIREAADTPITLVVKEPPRYVLSKRSKKYRNTKSYGSSVHLPSNAVLSDRYETPGPERSSEVGRVYVYVEDQEIRRENHSITVQIQDHRRQQPHHRFSPQESDQSAAYQSSPAHPPPPPPPPLLPDVV